jgi:hypothetical protein
LLEHINIEPKCDIGINNDELWGIMWKHMKEIKREERGSRRFFSISNFVQ